MDVVEQIISFLKKKNGGEEIISPEDLCPNCWGSQEYGDVVRKLEKDFQLEVNRGSGKYDFIKEFVVKHVDGIRLKNKVDGLQCEACELRIPDQG